MARDLKLEVELGLIDKALGPIKAITQGSGRLAKQLKASRDQMKEMNQQQRDIAAFRTANIEIAKQTRAMRDLQTKMRGHTEALEQQRTAHVNLKGNLKSAQTQYNKLSKALIEGKGTTAGVSSRAGKGPDQAAVITAGVHPLDLSHQEIPGPCSWCRQPTRPAKAAAERQPDLARHAENQAGTGWD